MKRFYQQAAAVPAEGGYAIALDAKPIRTPGRAALVVPAEPLAQAIAAEWQGQGEEIDPPSMPLTRLASTAIDWIGPHRATIVEELAAYAGTDLVCYRAEEPPELVARQQAIWQPLVDWVWLRYDAPLGVTTGIVPLAQSPAVLGTLRAAVAALDTWSLMALHALATAAGSLVIGLAGLEKRLDAGQIWAAAELDETFQMEQWGDDPLAAKRRAAIRRDIGDALRFAELLRI